MLTILKTRELIKPNPVNLIAISLMALVFRLVQYTLCQWRVVGQQEKCRSEKCIMEKSLGARKSVSVRPSKWNRIVDLENFIQDLFYFTPSRSPGNDASEMWQLH